MGIFNTNPTVTTKVVRDTKEPKVIDLIQGNQKLSTRFSLSTVIFP